MTAALMAALVTVVWAGISAALVHQSTRDGAISYVDADCHMRLERAAEIVGRGQYPFVRFPRSNPPQGETSHWGLPMDILLIVGAATLAPASGSFGGGMDTWSIWVGPALFGMFAFVLMSCTVRFGGAMAAGALAMLLVGSQAILHPFLPSRPDHHGLLLLLQGLAFASLASAEMSAARASAVRLPGGWALLASAGFSALAVWTSIESCALVALTGGWLAVRIVWPGAVLPSVRFLMLVRWAFALWFALLAAWVVERGGIGGPILWGTDALSPRFLAAGGIALVSAVALSGSLSSQSKDRRFLALAGVAVATIAAWACPPRLFPHLPKPETDFELMLGFLDRASTDGMPMFGGLSPGSRNFLEWYGCTLLLLPFASARVLRMRGTRGAISRLALGCAGAYGALGFVKMRWCPYAMAFAAPMVACWLAAMSRGLCAKRGAGASRTLAWCTLLTTATLVGFAGRIASSHWPPPSNRSPSTPEVDAALRMARVAWETDLSARGIASRKVLTHAALGPQIMHQWRASVIATPNVRNGAGIRKLFRWLLSTDLKGALSEIRAEGWTHALITCNPPPPEVEAFRQFAGVRDDLDLTLLGKMNQCRSPDLIGQWPLGTNGVSLRLIRLPSSDAEIARWSAAGGREP